jgi:hypothetical protein
VPDYVRAPARRPLSCALAGFRFFPEASVFALAAMVVFVIAAVRDFAGTAPTHQTGLLFVGLALVGLHLVWAIAVPRIDRTR